MMAGSHVLIGTAAWLYASRRLGLPQLDPVGLGLAAVGSLLPDIDHPKSWLGRRFRLVSVPLAAALGHRGFTHSALALAVCAAALRWNGGHWRQALPFVIGHASHLAADLVTPAGLCLAWPVRRTIGIPLVKTGSFGEQALVMLVGGWMVSRALGS